MEDGENRENQEEVRSVLIAKEDVPVLSSGINKIVASEISKGLRGENYDPDNEDIVDRTQRLLNVGNTTQEEVKVQLSQGDHDALIKHLSDAASNKVLSMQELMQLNEVFKKINKVFGKVQPQEEPISSFGMGSNSILGRWGKKRGEKGSLDGLG